MPIATSAAVSVHRHPRTNAPSVLIVDDVKSTRDRLSRVLDAGGYVVIEAADGRDALRALATACPVDAILLDLMMPSMDGWEFRQFQLRDPRLAHIPTLVITAKELAEYERYSLRIGSATLIHKPFEDSQVLEGLARVLVGARPAAVPSDNRWLTREGQPLLWSRRGGVACVQHAPCPDSDQWHAEGWSWIPNFAGKNKIEYACQRCSGGPIRHAGRRKPLES